MYTIDLFKGRNLPQQGSLTGIFIAGFAFCVPVLLVIVLFTGYLKEKVILGEQCRILADCRGRLAEMESAETYADEIVKDNREIRLCLADVKDALGRYVQWTDMLVELGEKKPDSLIVDQFNVIVRPKNVQVRSKHGENKIINVSVPLRILVVSMYSYDGSKGDRDVRNLQKKLLEGRAFSRFADDVVIAVREPDKIKKKNVIRYELNCILKTAGR